MSFTSTAITFRYKGISEAGSVVRGTMAAINEDDLYHRLLAAGFHLIHARPASSTGLTLERRLPTRDLLLFTLHLEQMLKAGIPLLDCLAEVEVMSSSKRLRLIVGKMRRAMEHGSLLSQALAQHPQAFDTIFVGLVETGEIGGDLTKPLQHIVNHLKWREAMSRRIGQALRYPLFALASALGSLGTLMVVVVPQLSLFLNTLGHDLPFETKMLIETSSFMKERWDILLVSLAAAIVTIWLVTRGNGKLRLLFDRAILRLPFIGPVVNKTALARFAYFMAILFDNGVGLLTCLRSTERLLGNQWLAAGVNQAAEKIEAGWSLSDALNHSKVFPRFFIRLVRVGEQSGNLGHSFETIREFYDRDAEDAVTQLTSSLQPTFVVVVGLTLLWVVVAIIGPVYNSFSTLPL